MTGAQVVFVSNTAYLKEGGAPGSVLASVRRELLIPAALLQERGIRTRVLSLVQDSADAVEAAARIAERVVFGKMLPLGTEPTDERFRANASAYDTLLERAQCAERSVFCFADDHFDAALFAQFYRDTARTAWAWVASSNALKEQLAGEARCPVLAYPEPAESAPRAPRVPAWKMRNRLGAWMARRSAVPLDAWRIRLLWFGHPSNLESLVREIPALRAFGARVPLRLECVTQADAAFAARLQAESSDDLSISLAPWSQGAVDAALERCDAVLLPQALGDRQKRLKSNNRLVDTLNAGRYALCHPLPAYQELAAYAWVGDSLVEGLEWLLHHPRAALARLVAGQTFVEREHSAAALGDFWLRALRLSAPAVAMP